MPARVCMCVCERRKERGRDLILGNRGSWLQFTRDRVFCVWGWRLKFRDRRPKRRQTSVDVGTSWNLRLSWNPLGLAISKPPTWMTPWASCRKVGSHCHGIKYTPGPGGREAVAENLAGVERALGLPAAPAIQDADKPQCCDCNAPCPAPASQA